MPFGSCWVPARAAPVRAAAGVVRPPRPDVAAAPASAAVLRKVLRSFFMVSSRRGRTPLRPFEPANLASPADLSPGRPRAPSCAQFRAAAPAPALAGLRRPRSATGLESHIFPRVFMNDQSRPSDLSLMKFGIGQPVPRKEDPKLVRGEGRYSDDVHLDGQAYAVFVRSPYAHGRIQGIEVEAARAMPGVLAVYTGTDLAAAGLGPMQAVFEFKNRDGTAMTKPPHPALPSDRVRYVGQPVACVVAETAAKARDAAEAEAIEIEELPAVTDPRQAAAPGAPRLHDELASNVVLDYHFGDASKLD